MPRGLGDQIDALDTLLDLLMPHTSAEEEGLFAEARAEGSLAEAVDRLCAEHDQIHTVLSAVDRTAPDWSTVLIALDRLHRHIDNEEHGLFPAAVIALPIQAWDRLTERFNLDPASRGAPIEVPVSQPGRG